MKALLLKDFYMITKYCRNILLLVLIFFIAGILSFDNAFLIIYPLVVVGMIPITLISYDEKFQWDRYSVTFPWSRKQLVTERYLLTAIILGITWLLSLLSVTIHAVTSNDWDAFSYMPVLISLGLFSPTLVLPFVFKLGTERARMIYYFYIGLLVAIMVVSTMALSFSNFLIHFPPVLAVTVSVLLFLGSWQLSIRFYQKREL